MKQNIKLMKQMGLRWTLYRSQYELKKKLGYLERKYPHINLEDIKDIDYIDINVIKQSIKNNLSELNLNPEISDKDLKSLIFRSEKILNDEFRYFFNDYYKFKGWNYSPKTEKYAYSNVHWSKISDLGEGFGDIKWIWDLNRFIFAYDLSRAYLYTKDEKYPEKFWGLFDDFILKNPLELGPNYRCSQEMSFRANAWLFALYYMLDSKHTNEKRVRTMIKTFIHYLKHNKNHLNFSVEAVRNNHSISEAVMLLVFGKTLDFLHDNNKYINIGEKTLLKELSWQILKDGSYIQNSHNYHRLVLQDLSWAILSYKSKNEEIPKIIKDKSMDSVKFFNSFISSKGEVPNYGMNDGSYIFPLTERNYLDYRPVLQNIYYQINKKLLFKDKDINELTSIFNKEFINESEVKSIKKGNIFKNGGYYISVLGDFKIIFKSKTYKERPNQADNHHLDIWYKDENIFKDAGTYSYNDREEILNYFNGTPSHNTVLINNSNQMTKGSRFIWYDWSRTSNVKFKMKKSNIEYHSKLLNYGSNKHIRKVLHSEERIIIEDNIINKKLENIDFKVQWLTEEDVNITDNEIFFNNLDIKVRVECEEFFKIKVVSGLSTPFRGWISTTYGEIHPANQIIICGISNKKNIKLKTYIEKSKVG